MFIDSVYQRRANLCRMIAEGKVDQDVLRELIAGDKAINEEAIVWDFKLELPQAPAHKGDKKEADAKFCEIMKDCVSFYNTYGGYLVIGVEDRTGDIKGWSSAFDAADLNKRLQAATGKNIETIYRVVNFNETNFGLLFTPKRQAGLNPAHFTKTATEGPTGRKAYDAGDFYFRLRDTSIPASTPEDFEFLYGNRELLGIPTPARQLENNLPMRDPDLRELRGRDHELSCLWSWLADQFNPVHILSGLGGLGKTSVAYTFAERVIFNALPALDRVIWLGAKVSTFSGPMGHFIPLPRVDFNDIDNLFIQILAETGCPPDQIPEEPSRDELLSLVVEHLSAFRYLLVVDNVDTLPDEDQQLIFNLLTQICSRSRSKAIITARRNLGASRAFYTEMSGLVGRAFEQLVADKCDLLRIKAPTPPELEQFAAASGGSPLFTLSLLRLVSLGDTYREAIQHWKGSDGEAVRAAAFKTEIARLTPHQGRVLLVLGYLHTASIAEISAVIKLNRFEIQIALEGLQGFSMTALDTSLPGGSVFTLPSSLYLVTDLLEKRVADWRDIKAECGRLVALRENKVPFVGQAITRAVSYLRNGEFDEAQSVASEALKSLPDSPDLHCLMGRCYREMDLYAQAEDHYQRAHELGFTKRDLFDGWLAVREERKDWRGVIEVSDKAEPTLKSSRYVIARDGARMQIGDEFARSGRYPEANLVYATALDDLRTAIQTYSGHGDKASLWRLYETLIFRWIGSIQVEGEAQVDANRRMFGAVFRAATHYRFWNERLLRAGIAALKKWLDSVERRQQISETGREHLATAHSRSTKLRTSLENKPTLLEKSRDELLDELKVLMTRIERLRPIVAAEL
ncbi:RNA-binding domain-containing protein [Rhizobium ruizarguesonis]